MNFFSPYPPACSVCAILNPLYLVLLIIFTLIFFFGNLFLQLLEEKRNKDKKCSISKSKLFKVIRPYLRICSQTNKSQIFHANESFLPKFPDLGLLNEERKTCRAGNDVTYLPMILPVLFRFRIVDLLKMGKYRTN